ncbi:MAG: hypothetical protein AAF402_13050 [Pseudomonadota bacterium]
MQVIIDLFIENKPGNTSRVFAECRKFGLTPKVGGKKELANGRLLAMRLLVEFDGELEILESHFSQINFLKLSKVAQAVGGVNASVSDKDLDMVQESGQEDIAPLDEGDDIDIFENYKGRRDKF